MRKLVLGTTWMFLSCGGGANAIYFRAVTAPATVPSGTNCPSQNNGTTTTVTNEGGLADAAIYLAPNNTVLLDIGLSGTNLLTGTQSGGNYTFTGKVIDDQKSTNNETVFENDTTVTLTVSGSDIKGTFTLEGKVTCESGCSGFTNSDCTSSAAFQGTVVPGIQNQTTLGPT